MISLTSCDVNKFLEDVATAMEESSQGQDPNRGGGSTSGGSSGSTETKVKTRTTERSQEIGDPIFAKLGLSNAQVDQYTAINKKYEQQITDLENSGQDRIKISTQLKKLKVAQEEELMGILTVEQKQKI